MQKLVLVFKWRLPLDQRRFDDRDWVCWNRREFSLLRAPSGVCVCTNRKNERETENQIDSRLLTAAAAARGTTKWRKDDDDDDDEEKVNLPECSGRQLATTTADGWVAGKQANSIPMRRRRRRRLQRPGGSERSAATRQANRELARTTEE